MSRVCSEPGCSELTNQSRCSIHAKGREQQRVARRGDLYQGDWPEHSRQRRDEEPWCHADDVGLPPCYRTDDLTVDHHADAPLCRSCHGKLEAARRAGRA